MAQSPEEEERYWEEEAGMRERSELGRGFEASPTERNWAVATHLAGLAGYLVPFAHIIAPLVIWLMKRDESEYIGWHACEALNFQISMLIYLAVATVLIWVLIGYLLLPLLALFNVVTVVLSALAASRGELRPYPLSLRLVS